MQEENVQMSEEKMELLKHILSLQNEDMNYHRDFQYKIFTWSSNMLGVLIGALLITQSNTPVVWEAYGIWGRIVASATVIIVTLFSLRWQTRHRQWHQEQRDVMTTIYKLLHCYDKGYFDPAGELTIFPERWLNEKKDRTLSVRWKAINYISATLLLGLFAIFMIWLP